MIFSKYRGVYVCYAFEVTSCRMGSSRAYIGYFSLTFIRHRTVSHIQYVRSYVRLLPRLMSKVYS